MGKFSNGETIRQLHTRNLELSQIGTENSMLHARLRAARRREKRILLSVSKAVSGLKGRFCVEADAGLIVDAVDCVLSGGTIGEFEGELSRIDPPAAPPAASESQ